MATKRTDIDEIVETLNQSLLKKLSEGSGPEQEEELVRKNGSAFETDEAVIFIDTDILDQRQIEEVLTDLG